MIRRRLVATVSGLAAAGAFVVAVGTPSVAQAAPSAAPATVGGHTVVMRGRPSAPPPGLATATTITPAGADFPYEWDVADAVGSQSGLNCVSMTGAKACFVKDGDKFYVQDTKSDGHSATASWQNWIYDDVDNYIWWRQGSCVNEGQAGSWAVCNKDFFEAQTKNDLDGYGSDIYWQACVYDAHDNAWFGCSSEEGGVSNDA